MEPPKKTTMKTVPVKRGYNRDSLVSLGERTFPVFPAMCPRSQLSEGRDELVCRGNLGSDPKVLLEFI